MHVNIEGALYINANQFRGREELLQGSAFLIVVQFETLVVLMLKLIEFKFYELGLNLHFWTLNMPNCRWGPIIIALRTRAQQFVRRQSCPPIRLPPGIQIDYLSPLGSRIGSVWVCLPESKSAVLFACLKGCPLNRLFITHQFIQEILIFSIFYVFIFLNSYDMT